MAVIPSRIAKQKKKKKYPRRPITQPWIFTIVMMGLYVLKEVSSGNSGLLSKIGHRKQGDADAIPDSLVVYDWKDPELGSRKQHMELVDMDTEVTPRRGGAGGKNNLYFDIGHVHQNGLYHTGIWTAVMDTNVTMEDAKLLWLKRGPQLFTCPNAWTFLGEHTYREEQPKDTVVRGLKEELGDAFYQQFLKTGAKTMPLFKHPAYFHLDYHDDRGRKDLQITYLYVVEMNTPLEDLQNMMRVDDEVAEVAWLTRQEIKDSWINPDVKFCRHEVAVMLQLMLDRLEDLQKEANPPPRFATENEEAKKAA